MGYFSECAIEDRREERGPSYPSQRDTLQYFLEDLEAKLDELDAKLPHDPMDPYYDRYFCSDCITHYYENPGTVQDVLFCIREVTELIRAIDEEEKPPAIELTGQLLGQRTLRKEDMYEQMMTTFQTRKHWTRKAS